MKNKSQTHKISHKTLSALLLRLHRLWHCTDLWISCLSLERHIDPLIKFHTLQISCIFKIHTPQGARVQNILHFNVSVAQPGCDILYAKKKSKLVLQGKSDSLILALHFQTLIFFPFSFETEMTPTYSLRVTFQRSLQQQLTVISKMSNYQLTQQCSS